MFFCSVLRCASFFGAPNHSERRLRHARAVRSQRKQARAEHYRFNEVDTCLGLVGASVLTITMSLALFFFALLRGC